MEGGLAVVEGEEYHNVNNDPIHKSFSVFRRVMIFSDDINCADLF